MHVMLFLREDCAAGPEALAACDGIEDLEVHDLEQVDGITHAAAFGVRVAPSVLVIDSDGREIASWRGEVPDRDRLRSLLAN